MQFDIFFSICQTEVAGFMPGESEMFANFFQQVEAADRLGFGTAWVAESHLSCEVQKRNPGAVIPHFKGRLQAPKDSHEWATNKRAEIFGRAGTAIMNAIQTHVAEKDAK